MNKYYSYIYIKREGELDRAANTALDVIYISTYI